MRITQRVDGTSATKHQHTRFPHFPDCFTECNMRYRVQTLLDRELNNGHLSLGKHEAQRYPCSMVETPGGIEITQKTCRLEKIDYLSGEIRTPL
jgi:hypothetical protein